MAGQRLKFAQNDLVGPALELARALLQRTPHGLVPLGEDDVAAINALLD